MALNSKIEWTQATWNPITGCTKISEGCKYCYAEKLARRLKGMKQKKYRNGFEVTLHDYVLEDPLSWKKPKMIFVCSMSDIFHKDVPISFVKKIFDVMERASQHQFQVLTKRAERLPEIDKEIKWPDNVWLGVTVELEKYLYRIDHLRNTGAKIKFISFEPLLGMIEKANLEGIDWVISGGESGPGARPMEKDWVRSIRDNCQEQNTPFFFKQWGGVSKKKNGRILDGRTWDEYPE